MNLYSIPTAITSALVFALGVFVYCKNRKSSVNKAFSLMCLATSGWLFFSFIAYNFNEEGMADIFMRICYIGIIFIPITMFHFITRLLDTRLPGNFLKFLYAYGLICGWSVIANNYLINGTYHHFWGYYPRAGFLHPIFLVIFIGLIVSCVILLLIHYFRSKTTIIKKKQIKYVLIALFIFDFASLDFIPNYGISIYSFGYIPTTIMLIIMTYSIIKLRLLDISLVVTRTGIFLAVYSLVLGIPFEIALLWQNKLKILIGESWWMIPLSSSTVLATIGPFIYLYIDRKAEEKIFQEQHRYQSTLRQASIGMGRIKDLSRLVNLIVHIVTRTVRIEHSMVYLYDSGSNKFQLRAVRARQLRFSPVQFIAINSSLVEILLNDKNPVIYEEIKQRTQDHGDLKLARLEAELGELDAALVVPSFVDEKLLAIMILGKKMSGKLYTQEDLAVFTILANQAALAIENAMFYEDMKQTHEQLFKAEKMATIGTMADGLSHQINNRLHALGFIAGDALDTIKLKKILPMSDELKEVLIDLEHALNRIQENVVQGGEVVRGLLKYTRKGEEGFAAVDLNHLVDESLEMAQFKIKKGDLVLQRDYTTSLPKIKGNFTQLQEVFFNLIDNAYDAMMQRKQELAEPGFKPILRISAQAGYNGFLNIQVQDNGIGIKDEDKNKVFTPFFTTKLSSKKGTGLGLYVIRKLIEENHEGKVIYKSVYKQGTLVEISLPIYTSTEGNN